MAGAAAALLGAGARWCVLAAPPGAAAAAARPLDLQLWHWSATRQLSGEETAELARLPLQAVCRWCGVIAAEGGVAAFHPRGGRLLGGPLCAEWPVIRLEPGCTAFLERSPALLAEVVMGGWRQAQVAGMAMAGLQLDWDVPSRLLPAYADFLRRVRALLPAAAGLSCTGLVSWLDADGIAAVAAAVDWWVPQCYSTDVPGDPMRLTALVARAPVERVTARCEALGRPFRIGLPTYEQASLWDASGRLLAATLPLALEQAVAAGFTAVPLQAAAGQGERLAAFRIAQSATCAGLRLPGGALLVVGEPTVASLRAQIAAVRRQARRWCAGISLFRMPRPGDLPCLGARQLAAAWSPSEPSGGDDARWTFEHAGGQWTLTIANHGLDDAMQLERGLRLAVAGVGEARALPEGVRAVPALDGIPVAPTHADGVLLVIPFLRAQSTISVTFAADGERVPSCRRQAQEQAQEQER